MPGAGAGVLPKPRILEYVKEQRGFASRGSPFRLFLHHIAE